MPYIVNAMRRAIELRGLSSLITLLHDGVSAGELNYILTRLLAAFIGAKPTYGKLNEAIGVLECAKLELYRRMAAPYEDRKIAENGDVYP